MRPRPARAPRRRRTAVAVLALAAVVAVAVLSGRSQGPAAAPAPPARPPGLADLWAGRATPVLDRMWSSRALHASPGSGAYSGAHVEIVGRRWYLFNRRTEPAICPRTTTPEASTLVRESRDAGRTWGRPVAILEPTPGTAWSCVATDGDAVYDRAAGRWRYLFQCLSDGGPWNGCYAERRGRSPLGRFTAPDTRPVIPSGLLWNAICDPGDSCAPPAVPSVPAQEGTFSLTPAPGGGWWVGFHGYDGVHGFRGLARTSTFALDGWRTDGARGTPRDAIAGPRDAQGWRETWDAGGPIGAGAGSLLAEDGWYYSVVEVPDRNLGCTPGQHWDLGLFRARDVAAARWEPYPGGNPLVYSSRTPTRDGVPAPCSVAYPGLLRDPGTGRTYLMYGRIAADQAHDGIYLYRLEWNRNLLRNGGVNRAGLEGWTPLAGTGAAPEAVRDMEGSPDGTPRFALGTGVRQVTAASGRSVAFGATVRGGAEADLEQLDGDGGVLATDTIRGGSGARWQRIRRTVAVARGAVRLRYTLRPLGAAPVAADNLLVIPQDGCHAPRYPAC